MTFRRRRDAGGARVFLPPNGREVLDMNELRKLPVNDGLGGLGWQRFCGCDLVK
jgi:hypothetical protein